MLTNFFVQIVRSPFVTLFVQILKDCVIYILLRRCEVIKVDSTSLATALSFLQVVPWATVFTCARCMPAIDTVEGLRVLVPVVVVVVVVVTGIVISVRLLVSML